MDKQNQGWERGRLQNTWKKELANVLLKDYIPRIIINTLKNGIRTENLSYQEKDKGHFLQL